MWGGKVGLGGLGAVGTGALAGTGGGIGAGASVAGLEICPPVSGGEPPAPFAGGSTCGEEDGNSSANKTKSKKSRYVRFAVLADIGSWTIGQLTYIYVQGVVGSTRVSIPHPSSEIHHHVNK